MCALGCAPPGGSPPAREVDAGPREAPRWVLGAAAGAGFAAGAGRVWGALRAQGDRVGEGPLPASPLVLAAQLDETRWRFAAADGTLYAAEGFLGPLRRTGALRQRPRALPPSTPRWGRGALVVVDALGASWIDDGDGPPRQIPAPPAAHALAVGPGVVVFALQGGRVARSDDGGRTVRLLAPVEGAAWDVGFDAQGPWARGPRGAFRLDGTPGVPAVPPAPQPPAEPLTVRARRLAWAPARASAVTWALGQFAVTDGARVTRCASLEGCASATASLAAPGVDCALHALRGALVAVCVREGWARVASVLSAPDGAWRTLRDESRGAPMGDARFDPDHDLWAVAAPCAQRPIADPRRLCVVRGGVAREHTLPFAVRLQDVHDDAVLVMDAEASPQGPVRAALLRRDDVRAFALPYPRRGAWRAALRGELVLPHFEATAGPLRAVVRGDLRGAAPRWRSLSVPPGSTDLVVTDDGHALTVGDDAQSLAWFDAAGARRPLPSPVDGDPRTLRVEPGGERYCVGDVCRLGANLALRRRDPRPSARALAREDLPADAPAVTPPRPLRVRCVDDGPAAPGVEMDHGAAMAGYAIRAARAGERVDVRWFGATVNGRATATWPGPPGEVFFALGAVGATQPNALLARCDRGRCDHALMLDDGLRALDLPPAAPGEVALFTEDARWIVRADPGHGPLRSTHLAVLRPGTPGAARGDYAFLDRAAGVDAGSLDGADGLWVRVSPSRLRFYDLRGEARGEVTEERAGCAREGVPRGVIHRVEGAADVQGDGWRVEAGEWVLEETLRVYDGVACTAAVGGGEPREEPPPSARGREEGREVRTFSLLAAGRDLLRGTAWGGRRAFPQRCALNP